MAPPTRKVEEVDHRTISATRRPVKDLLMVLAEAVHSVTVIQLATIRTHHITQHRNNRKHMAVEMVWMPCFTDLRIPIKGIVSEQRRRRDGSLSRRWNRGGVDRRVHSQVSAFELTA